MHKVALVVVVLAAVARSAPAPKPEETVSFGAPTVSGSRDAKGLAVAVKKITSKLIACFGKAQPPEVDATVTFTIDADGKVTNAETTGAPDDVAACISEAVSKIKFAASKETTGVVYPMKYMRTVDLTRTRGGILGTISPTDGGGPFVSITGDVSSGFDGDGTASTGWGTIGTGHYGTIGHGSGTGRGYGVGHGVGSRPAPLVSIGQPTVIGDLDKAIVRRYIKRNIQKLQYCYEKELLVTKTLQGTITAEFTIDHDGAVGSSTATGMKSKAVETCVALAIHDIEFPKPKGDSEVTVKYPFTFTPPAKTK